MAENDDDAEFSELQQLLDRHKLERKELQGNITLLHLLVPIYTTIDTWLLSRDEQHQLTINIV